MTRISRRAALAGLLGSGLLPKVAMSANYSTGVTDDRILLGQPIAYSGPASAYGSIGKVHLAYFKMLNQKGGIRGRKIEIISVDDGYNPARTVQVVRRMVEQDQVFAIFGIAGTACNLAVQKYLASKQVPQLFCYSGSPLLVNPEVSKWSVGWLPATELEGEIYGQYVAANIKDPKVGILYQNDDYGRDMMNGFRRGLGSLADKAIVRAISYEVTDPTVEPQVLDLLSSGATTFLGCVISKAASQAIRKTAEIGWPGERIIPFASASIGAVLKPAGLDAAKGLVTSRFLKDPSDARWQSDPGVMEFLSFLKTHEPSVDPNDLLVVLGYCVSQTLAVTLENCGDNLTRENIMQQSVNLKDVSLPMLLPGVTLNSTPTNRSPIRKLQMARFDGVSWSLFGEPLSR